MRLPLVASITNFHRIGLPMVATVSALQLLAPSAAQAIVVTVDGEPWDLQTVTGSFGDGTNVGGFNLTDPANAPWWGDENRALRFAEAVGAGLGLQDRGGEESGPLFAWAIETRVLEGNSVNLVRSCAFFPAFDPDCEVETTPAVQAVYARATLVPGPLPVLGAAAAFGYSRKLRQRINGGTTASPTTPGA